MLFDLSLQKDFLLWGQNLSRVFFHQSVSAPLEKEKTTVLVVHDYTCG